MDKPRKLLTLVGADVMWLSDAIHDTKLDGHADASLSRDALVLLGSAFVEVATSKTPYLTIVKLSLDEETCWLFRESVKTTSVYGDQPIGVDLLRRIYEVLNSFNSAVDFDTVDVEELPDDYAEKLAALKENMRNG